MVEQSAKQQDIENENSIGKTPEAAEVPAEQKQGSGKSFTELMGDCPNLEVRLVPGNPLWQTIAHKGNLECQRHYTGKKARIVAEDGLRLGNGSVSAMLEKMDRLADEDFRRPGDILGVVRKGLYEHYAIYLGENRVIHYAGENADFTGRVTVHEAAMEEFLKDAATYFVLWFDEGRPIKLRKATSFLLQSCMDLEKSEFRERQYKVFSAEETIARAKSRLGEEKYNLVTNNCEHFAMWCKTGEGVSSQVKQMVEYARMARILSPETIAREGLPDSPRPADSKTDTKLVN